MSDIADMHVEAYEAGLDPNDMDGADWADFYSTQEPVTPETLIDDIGSSARFVLNDIDDMQDEDALDLSVTGRAETVNLYLPDFSVSDAKTLVELLVKLSEAANAEGDKLRAARDKS